MKHYCAQRAPKCFMFHTRSAYHLIIIICYHQYSKTITNNMSKLLPKIIFYALIVGVAIAGTLLYVKTRPAAMNNEQQTMNNSTGSPASCIITIDGQKYDVESLRSTHTGGDIFQCGTDMSAAFHHQHDDNFQMIQKYLVK